MGTWIVKPWKVFVPLLLKLALDRLSFCNPIMESWNPCVLWKIRTDNLLNIYIFFLLQSGFENKNVLDWWTSLFVSSVVYEIYPSYFSWRDVPVFLQVFRIKAGVPLAQRSPVLCILRIQSWGGSLWTWSSWSLYHWKTILEWNCLCFSLLQLRSRDWFLLMFFCINSGWSTVQVG